MRVLGSVLTWSFKSLWFVKNLTNLLHSSQGILSSFFGFVALNSSKTPSSLFPLIYKYQRPPINSSTILQNSSFSSWVIESRKTPCFRQIEFWREQLLLELGFLASSFAAASLERVQFRPGEFIVWYFLSREKSSFERSEKQERRIFVCGNGDMWWIGERCNARMTSVPAVSLWVWRFFLLLFLYINYNINFEFCKDVTTTKFYVIIFM